MAVRYLLDTHTISYIAKGNSRAARQYLERLSKDEELGTSAITEA